MSASRAVLEIGSAIGDFGQLGHASSLQRGQRVPDGKRYAGSPAEETTTNFRLADETPARPLRRALFTASRLAFVLAVAGALAEAVVLYLMDALTEGDDALALKPWDATFARAAAGGGDGARPSWLGALVVGLLVIYAVPRLANLFLERRQGLSALRLPPRHAADRRDRRQLGVLQPDVRRLGLHRVLPALGRLDSSASAWRRARTSAASRARTIRSSARSAPTRSPPTACRLGNLTMSSRAFRLEPVPHRREQLPRHR